MVTSKLIISHLLIKGYRPHTKSIVLISCILLFILTHAYTTFKKINFIKNILKLCNVLYVTFVFLIFVFNKKNHSGRS